MQNDKNVTFICDPLLSEYGPLRPAILIAKKLKEKGKDIRIVSTTISPELQRELDCFEIQTLDLLKEPLLKKNESIAWLEEWSREAIFSMNSRGIGKFEGVTLNFSNTICSQAHVWYAQGPPTVTLDNMRKYLPPHYKASYFFLRPFLRIFDEAFIRRVANCSANVISNSKYLASVYNGFGVPVDNVIYPPLDCEKFKPTTAKPSGDFVLTYFGKETIFDLIKRILDIGMTVKAFGGKLLPVHKKICEHPNLDFLGRIDDQRLTELYSNALFTLYPFSDEPFGYIPIESLACGTPVLTFDRQGPKETVNNQKTGWLVKNDVELLNLAFQVWKKGYPNILRKKCRQKALEFDIDKIMVDWESLLNHL